MKEVVFSEEIRNDPEAFATVEQATRLLEAEQGPSAASVTATWSVGRDKNGQRVFELKLADPIAVVQGQFTSEELKNRERAQRRLNWLWDDWLGKSSQAHLKKVREILQQL